MDFHVFFCPHEEVSFIMQHIKEAPCGFFIFPAGTKPGKLILPLSVH